MKVLQMSHRLTAPPTCRVAEGIAVRTFMPSDVPEWLALRMRAFAAETPPVRPWTAADFAREMIAKPWWRDGHTWLATPSAHPGELVGAVTLGMRKDVPVVHWLMVDPAWRRRGIGRALVVYLENAAWRFGEREVFLETHCKWRSAVEFYDSLGYESITSPD